VFVTGVLEWWSNSIADLGMRNADCALQIEVSDLQFIFSIRNPKSEITITPLLQYSSEHALTGKNYWKKYVGFSR